MSKNPNRKSNDDELLEQEAGAGDRMIIMISQAPLYDHNEDDDDRAFFCWILMMRHCEGVVA